MQGARRMLAGCAAALALGCAAAAVAQAPVPSAKKPVLIDGKAIKRGVLRHWQKVMAFSLGDRRGWMGSQYRISATEYLIERRWIAGEARDRQIKVPRKEVAEAIAKLKARDFPRSGDWERHLKRTRLKERDVTFSVRGELLAQRITAQVVEGSADVHEAQTRVHAYRAEREERWQPRTLCASSWRLPEWCA